MTLQTPTPTDAISEMAIGRTDADTNKSAGKSTRKFRRSMPAQISGVSRLLITPPSPIRMRSGSSDRIIESRLSMSDGTFLPYRGSVQAFMNM
jgi:hypothetical protein